MTHSLTQNQQAHLQECLALAQDPTQQEQASQTFSQLVASVEPSAAAAALLQALWSELLAARRSSAFWQQISDAEKGMSERLAATNVQLQQNYLRLMQEQ